MSLSQAIQSVTHTVERKSAYPLIILLAIGNAILIPAIDGATKNDGISVGIVFLIICTCMFEGFKKKSGK